MQLRPIIVAALVLAAVAPAARADELSDAFKARIEAALSIDDAAQRASAVRGLFYGADLDQFTRGLLERTIGRIEELRGQEISFEPLPPDLDLIHIVDGYEYRPSIEPLGRVVFTDSAAAPGNNTKVLYGRHPDEPRLAFPVTERRLVNPDAPPDKQLQILTIGVAHPPATFTGWCDIALSNNTIKRVDIEDQGIGNQTLIMRGQSIEACEVTNTTGHGSLSLRLYEDDREIFLERVETPAARITYRKP